MISFVVSGAATLPWRVFAMALYQCRNRRSHQTPDGGHPATTSIADEGGKDSALRRLCCNQSRMSAQLDFQLQPIEQSVRLGRIFGSHVRRSGQHQS